MLTSSWLHLISPGSSMASSSPYGHAKRGHLGFTESVQGGPIQGLGVSASCVCAKDGDCVRCLCQVLTYGGPSQDSDSRSDKSYCRGVSSVSPDSSRTSRYATSDASGELFLRGTPDERDPGMSPSSDERATVTAHSDPLTARSDSACQRSVLPFHPAAGPGLRSIGEDSTATQSRYNGACGGATLEAIISDDDGAHSEDSQRSYRARRRCRLRRLSECSTDLWFTCRKTFDYKSS
ncbi:hypothetical protein Btru_035149 [Bulinus truncatus]|nr:hypothetical protein Btru_035149 [Bulinus truncatus]